MSPPPNTLSDWVTHYSIPFAPASPEPALDALLATLSPEPALLALGEPLHGDDTFLTLRNQLFEHLVLHRGYTAIAIESSYPRGLITNAYVTHAADAPACYDAVQHTGFSHNFGTAAPNRQLVEWMRAYNATHGTQLHFYGFDAPTEMSGADSPRQSLTFAIDYLAAIDPAGGESHRRRIEPLLGADADWSNPAASFDPSKAVGLSPNATALRLAAEDLMTDLQRRRPELIARSEAARYLEAVHHAHVARTLLTYHAVLAGTAPTRIADLLGIRDLIMADTLAHCVERERARGGGKVFAFAHNSHLQRNMARWQLGPHALAWWPAGAHLHHTLGTRFANIGSAIGRSTSQGVGSPEPDTIEHHLTTAPAPQSPGLFIPTRAARSIADAATLATRSSSPKNPSYFPLTPESFAAFDAFAVLTFG